MKTTANASNPRALRLSARSVIMKPVTVVVVFVTVVTVVVATVWVVFENIVKMGASVMEVVVWSRILCVI